MKLITCGKCGKNLDSDSSIGHYCYFCRQPFHWKCLDQEKVPLQSGYVQKKCPLCGAFHLSEIDFSKEDALNKIEEESKKTHFFKFSLDKTIMSKTLNRDMKGERIHKEISNRRIRNLLIGIFLTCLAAFLLYKGLSYYGSYVDKYGGTGGLANFFAFFRLKVLLFTIFGLVSLWKGISLLRQSLRTVKCTTPSEVGNLFYSEVFKKKPDWAFLFELLTPQVIDHLGMNWREVLMTKWGSAVLECCQALGVTAKKWDYCICRIKESSNANPDNIELLVELQVSFSEWDQEKEELRLIRKGIFAFKNSAIKLHDKWLLNCADPGILSSENSTI